MKDIADEYPEYHKRLVQELPIIVKNVDQNPSRNLKKEVYMSMMPQFVDNPPLHERFAKNFDLPYMPWRTDREDIITPSENDMHRMLEQDARNPHLAYRSAISAVNPHVRVIGDDGSIGFETKTFGIEPKKPKPTKSSKTKTKSSKGGTKKRKRINKKKTKK
jgi:hypothetical protein